MEGDKEAYLEEATKALRRQRKVIFDLENHKLQLVRSLGVCRSKENTRKDSQNANTIADLAKEQVNSSEYITTHMSFCYTTHKIKPIKTNLQSF